MGTKLAGLALLLTGDRTVAGDLVHTALTRAHSDRRPDERAAVTALVRAWSAGGRPAGEPPDLTDDLELARRSLEALPEHQRLTVVLHHWSGLTVAEIAAVLRRPDETVADDLAAGVAQLYQPPAEMLPALVVALGPVPVDLDQVREAARRNRRRAMILAAGVLAAAVTGAALLAPGEPEPAATKDTPVRVVTSYGGAPAVVDVKALVLTAQLNTANVLPAGVERPPRFTKQDDRFYSADAMVGSTQLIFFLHTELGGPATEVLCTVPSETCTNREFPDGTLASVMATVEPPTGLSLTAVLPDGAVLTVHTMAYAAEPLELDTEDLFRFATVFN